MEKSHSDHPAQNLIFKEELTEEEIHTFAHACVREGHADPGLFMDAIRHVDPELKAGLGMSFSKGEMQDESKILAEMIHPLAIFHGKEDQIIKGTYYEQLNLPTLWRGKVNYIDQAGHSPQFENPETFNALLDEFVKEIT
jgi:pimeloyl-ACP methyl ester carboxylesterase